MQKGHQILTRMVVCVLLWNVGFTATSLDSLYHSATGALQQGKYHRAYALLKQLLTTSWHYRGADHLPAVYWAIVAAEKSQPTPVAVSLLNRALKDSLLHSDPAIQYLWVLFQIENPDVSKLADSISTTYYAILDSLTPGKVGLWPIIYSRHEFFIPDSVREAIQVWEQQNRLFPQHPLTAFWRALDPTPSTRANEAILAYLIRLRYVLIHYPHPGNPGFDDRGKLYIQLGPPIRKGSFQQDPTTDLQPYDYRPHEIWAYWQISPRLYFVFVDYQDGKGFRLAPSIEDALPLSLPVRKRIQFYEQLGRYAADLYYRIDLIERVYRDEPNPSSARNKMLQELRLLDDTNAEITRRITPTFYVQQFAKAREFPLEIRSALLATNTPGKNLLVLAIGLPAKEMAQLTRKINFTQWEIYLNTAIKNANNNLIQQFSDTLLQFDTYNPLDSITFRKYLIISTNPFVVTGELNWYGEREKLPGMRLLGAFTTFQTEVRHLLPPTGKNLAISDVLLSITPPQGQNPEEVRQWFIHQHWPYQWIPANRPLYLYFELYNLLRGPDGLARYRVAYRVKDMGQRRNFLKRLIQLILPNRGTITSEGEYAAEAPNAKQWIALDLSAYQGGRMLQIQIEVTDLITQQRDEKTFQIGVW